MSKLITLLLLLILLVGCNKYEQSYSIRRDFKCIGISTPVYHGTWLYFMIKHPSQSWQQYNSNSTLTFNSSDTVYLSFFPSYCISNDLSCGFFELSINQGVTFSSYISEDTMYLHNDVTGIKWKLLRQ